ncbi:hypothetical protein GSS87_09220 [Corynebacterium sp. 4HC-13]|nr:hypothetical protein [Corynebacterium anserum]MBC2682563.1 hypothetical protein [Corynebacterium anserum]
MTVVVGVVVRVLIQVGAEGGGLTAVGGECGVEQSRRQSAGARPLNPWL